MKSTIGSTMKPKGKGVARQMNRTHASDASSGNYEGPREQLIAEAAYFRAEQRGFVPGNEMSDWLEAEADVEGVLRNLQ